MRSVPVFVTNVGLITSNGPHGDNIMSAEWTYQISYEPLLIAICIRSTRITAENIVASKEFGISMAAVDQNVVSSIAGNHHGNEVDKIAALKEHGVSFYAAHMINALMVEGAAATMECKLVQVVDIGDHPIYIGEVVELSVSDKQPITYYTGKYFTVGEHIPKPEETELASIGELIRKHTKIS